MKWRLPPIYDRLPFILWNYSKKFLNISYKLNHESRSIATLINPFGLNVLRNVSKLKTLIKKNEKQKNSHIAGRTHSPQVQFRDEFMAIKKWERYNTPKGISLYIDQQLGGIWSFSSTLSVLFHLPLRHFYRNLYQDFG